jgi:serine/threonine-protein kinase
MPPPEPDHAQVKALFNELADIEDPAAREARLQALQAEPVLAARVRALLQASDTGQTRFGAPVAGMLASAAATELAPGDRLGAWTLRSELGHGGMGRVFLAERSDGHYEQRAAVKLLLGLSSDAALAQLAAERQILARLTHPHIARLIDGGTTPRGNPYLVMEYVEGRRIDAWCRSQGLQTDGVLDLFGMVCEAVGYAHRQLVVHCDIKPGNVLVDADGRAMLLDFGIAQLQGRQGSDVAALTPRYASPEQIAGAPATPASDIYSLGRMLDELLGAVQPAAPRADEWHAIVAKATAQDPEQRYLAVPALLADLRRFRSHLPLAALPPGRLYVARKLVRRRWPWVLAGSGALALSAVFVGGLVQQRDRALQAEAQARLEAATTRQVSDFMVSLFEGADPNIAGRQDLGAAALVDKGRERIDADLAGQPGLQAALKYVLGKVYENIGRPRTAIELYEQAVQAARRQPQRDPVREAALLSRLANALANERLAARAEPLAREALALLDGRVAPDATARADALDTLGWVLTSAARFDEGQQRLESARDIRQLRAREAPLDLAGTLHNLGLLHMRAGRPVPAEALFRQALALKQAALGDKHPALLNTLQSLASDLAQEHRSDEALALLRTLVERRRALHGPLSAKVAVALNELASALQDAGRSDEAIAAYRQALVVDEQVSGHVSTDRAVHLNNLATALEDQGDPAAEASYRESLAIRQALLPAGDLTLARSQHNLGRWLLRAGRPAQARALLDEAAQARRARLPAGHAEVVDSALAIAECQLAAGELEAAAATLAEAGRDEAALSPMRRASLWRAQGLLAAARQQQALALDRHGQALQLALRTVGEAHPALLRLRLDLAEAQAAAGQPAAAQASLQAARPALAAQGPASLLRQRAGRLDRRLAAA